jgi:predicted xylose isomerase-like sugar epimerase
MMTADEARDLEKAIIALDNALREKRGDKKSSAISDKIAADEVKRLREKYGVKRKSWRQ